MKFEIEFHDSEITHVSGKDSEVEIGMDAVLIVTDQNGRWLSNEDHRIPVTIKLRVDKKYYLPKKGELFDGGIREIQGSSKKGLLPIDFSYKGHCQLWLQMESGEYMINASELSVMADRNAIPKHLLK